MSPTPTDKLIALRYDLAVAEAKANELASVYGEAFVRYNDQKDRVIALRREVQEAEQAVLDAITG